MSFIRRLLVAFKSRITCWLVLSVLAAGLGSSFIFGYNIGVINVAGNVGCLFVPGSLLVWMRFQKILRWIGESCGFEANSTSRPMTDKDYLENLSEAHKNQLTFIWSLVGGFFPLGAMFGGLSTGFVADRFGRWLRLRAEPRALATWPCVQQRRHAHQQPADVRGRAADVRQQVDGLVPRAAARPLPDRRQLRWEWPWPMGAGWAGWPAACPSAGLNSGLAPMYLTEIAPVAYRGLFGSVNQLMVTISILIANLLGFENMLGTDALWPYLLGELARPPPPRPLATRGLQPSPSCRRCGSCSACPSVPRAPSTCWSRVASTTTRATVSGWVTRRQGAGWRARCSALVKLRQTADVDNEINAMQREADKLKSSPSVRAPASPAARKISRACFVRCAGDLHGDVQGQPAALGALPGRHDDAVAAAVGHKRGASGVGQRVARLRCWAATCFRPCSTRPRSSWRTPGCRRTTRAWPRWAWWWWTCWWRSCRPSSSTRRAGARCSWRAWAACSSPPSRWWCRWTCRCAASSGPPSRRSCSSSRSWCRSPRGPARSRGSTWASCSSRTCAARPTRWPWASTGSPPSWSASASRPSRWARAPVRAAHPPKQRVWQRALEQYTFLIFTAFLAFFWLFTYKFIPETKNRTVEKVHEKLRRFVAGRWAAQPVRAFPAAHLFVVTVGRQLLDSVKLSDGALRSFLFNLTDWRESFVT